MKSGPFLLSPRSVGLFLECPRCFWLEMNYGKKRPEFMFPSLPNGIDRILKEHFDKHRQKGLLPPELRKAGFSGTLFKDQGLLDYWRDWKRGLKADVPHLETTVRGAIDDLLVSEDGETLIPFDFKTRGSAPISGSHKMYDHQMSLYGFILEKMGYKVDKKAYLLFYHPHTVNDDGLVIFNADLVETKIDNKNTEGMIKSAIDTLKGPMPSQGNGCGFCVLRGGDRRNLLAFTR